MFGAAGAHPEWSVGLEAVEHARDALVWALRSRVRTVKAAVSRVAKAAVE